MKHEISLPHDLEEFLQAALQLPRFDDASDVIVEALYRFKDYYDLQCFKRDKLREELQKAIDQVDRGEALDGPMVMAKIRQKVKAAVAEADRIKHERLKAEIQKGIDEADRGELIDADEVFDRLERELTEPEMPNGDVEIAESIVVRVA